MATSDTTTPVAVTVPEHENPGGILPWAVPLTGNQLGSIEDMMADAFRFASALEAFSSTEITVAADQGVGMSRVRTFFVAATIPGLPDKIPVYGLKETRKMINKLTEFSVEVYVFNGQERVKTGTAFYTVKPDKSFGEFRLYTNEFNYNIASGNVSGSVPTIYDAGGNGIFVLSQQSKKGKSIVYAARHIAAAGRQLADIEVKYDTSFRTKKFKKASINFANDVDPVLKPQLVLTSLMIMYIRRMF